MAKHLPSRRIFMLTTRFAHDRIARAPFIPAMPPMPTRITKMAVVVAAAGFAVAAGGVKPPDPNAQEPLHQHTIRVMQSRCPAPAAAAAHEEALLSEVDPKLSAI